MGNLTYQVDNEVKKDNINIRRNNNINKNNIRNNNIRNNKKRKIKNKQVPIWKKILITLLILFVLGSGVVAFLLYGPYPNFREWLITTAMTTMTHQYLATWFYDDATIQDVLARNSVKEIEETTDPTLTVIMENNGKKEYANEYERQILEKDSEDQVYKIIEIEGKKYSGYLAAVYDPSRVKTVVTKKLGTCGQYLKTMAEENDALLAVNGGGFIDPNYNSNGANPLGITFSDGKLVTSHDYKGAGGLIGLTEENKLVLGKMSVQKARELKVRDAVTFAPFLIVNGKSSEILGNGGWGTAPRTVIGQRKDGIILFLVLDGRTVKKPGADMDDLIEIMENYGAYNAANLDGGTSSVMYANGRIINDPIDSTGAHKTRFISTGFIVTKDDNENDDNVTDSNTEDIIENSKSKNNTTKNSTSNKTSNTSSTRKNNTTSNSSKNTTNSTRKNTTNTYKSNTSKKTNKR